MVDSVDSKIKGLEYGADVYIEKPFSLGYVKATVESLLENRKRAFRHFASRPGFPVPRKTIWAATTGSGWTS